MKRIAIRAEGLVKRFRQVTALDGLDLRVEAGVVYGFLGPNGAGKTTTMRLLSGLAKPDHGEALILGHPVELHDPSQKARLGILPEEPSFYHWMTPTEYLRDFVAPLYEMSPGKAAERTAEVLEIVGLVYAASRRIGGFSRGMRQRLGLAQALIHKPQVLLLDEPVSALDPSGRKEMLELIGELRGEITILLSTHILADVERICDVIGIIDHGRMVIEESRQALLARYASPILEVQFDGDDRGWSDSIQQHPNIDHVQEIEGTIRLWVNGGSSAQVALLESLAAFGAPVKRFERVTPSLEDVFLRLIERSDQGFES